MDTLLRDYCKDSKIDSLLGTSSISRSLRDVDRVSVAYSSKYMCTRVCPCSANISLPYWFETPKRLADYNRTA